MKRVIYTLYQNTTKSGDIVAPGDWENHNEYFDRLLQCKKDYAKICGADFKFYENTVEEWDTSEVVVSSQFVKINLYKLHLFEELAKEYDEVLYLDLDVIINTEVNIFDTFDLNKGLVFRIKNDEIVTKDISQTMSLHDVGMRNPTVKYHITKELLGSDSDPNVINTGILLGDSKHIGMLKFSERLPEISMRIEKAVDFYHYIKIAYTPNNEAIFSYLIEDHNIPYQTIGHEWHDIRNMEFVYEPFGKFVHMINKNFYLFYKDKTQVIFSIHMDIPDNKLDQPGKYPGDNITKAVRTKNAMNQYYNALYKNKADYAAAIGVDFCMVGYDEAFEKFAEQYPLLTIYDIINLYKIHLLDVFAEKYDQVLYLDFDVVCMSNDSFFDHNNCDTHVCCMFDNFKERAADEFKKRKIEDWCHDHRSPFTKYWNAHALSMEYDAEPTDSVFNTGIVGASKKSLSKLRFFEDMPDIIDTMTELKQDDSMYPGPVVEQFGYDNETIFGFKSAMNSTPIGYLGSRWHAVSRANPLLYSAGRNDADVARAQSQFDAFIKDKKPVFVHMISKQFELVFKDSTLST
jgi:lipopolysaccharide biosynthesis glycosyltransferase